MRLVDAETRALIPRARGLPASGAAVAIRASPDVDMKGVAIPPAAWIHGCVRPFEQASEAADIGRQGT